MYIAAGIVLCLIALVLFEYRIKKPGQIVLFETNGRVKHRTGSLYARHFSVLMQNKTYTAVSTVEAETRKKISLNVKFSVTLSPSLEHIDKLIHITGWAGDPISDAGNEIDIMLQGYIKEYIDTQELEDIRSKNLSEYLSQKISGVDSQFGVEIISLTIQSIDPTDKKISEAIRQKEVTRIMEETEKMNQSARITTAQMKLQADEQISKAEHELALKKLHLKEEVAAKEAGLELAKLNEQLKRDKLRLAIEKEEMSILKENPEVLLLSPQIARLAEASQNMKNARTVVSLGDFEGGSKVVDTLRDFISNIFHAVGEKKKDA
jgi:hypothetical protein